MRSMALFQLSVWTAAMLSGFATLPAIAENIAGVRQITAHSAERNTALDVTIWYPAQGSGQPVVLGETPFFVGTSSMRDAPMAPGKHPLLLLSHGAGLAGNPQALSWIAAPLAKHGFVVAAPTHPGNSGPQRSAAETMKLWLRPVDLTETLNAVLASAALRDQIETDKIGVLGLSMGGNTALTAAGARLSPARLASYCDGAGSNPSLCGWLKQTGVDLHKLDMSAAGRDGRERRVRFAMAIDPAPIDVFEHESLSKVQIPVEIVNLGEPGQLPATLKADRVAQALPKAKYTVIEAASHYSMFGECKPGAAALAQAEKIDEPICSDGTGSSRRPIHAELVKLAIAAFERELKSPR